MTSRPLKKRRVSHRPDENTASLFGCTDDEDLYSPLPLNASSVVSFQDADLPVLLNDSEIGLSLTEEDNDKESAYVYPDHASDLPSPTLLHLPDDLLAHVGSFLNVGSLKGSRLVCRKLCRILSRDNAGWSAHCQRLWTRKVHIPPAAQALWKRAQACGGKHHNRALEAYRSSCMDARLRHEIQHEEFVYDPQAGHNTVWDFRFKGSAGLDWTIYDPWYAGMLARKMVFLPNGSVKQLVEETVVGDQPTTNRPRVVTRLRNPFFDSRDPTGIIVTWRYVLQPMDLPAKAQGAYVRLTVGGRDVPTYLVHRSPCNNWGFIMESCWGVFASFSLPPRQVVTTHEPQSTDSIPRNPRFTHLSEAGMPVNLHDRQVGSLDDNAELLGNKLQKRKKQDLLEDSSLSVTNRWQWREALLYNSGANSLPDGPSATAEFDEAWSAAVSRLQAFGFSLQQISDRLRM